MEVAARRRCRVVGSRTELGGLHDRPRLPRREPPPGTPGHPVPPQPPERGGRPSALRAGRRFSSPDPRGSAPKSGSLPVGKTDSGPAPQDGDLVAKREAGAPPSGASLSARSPSTRPPRRTAHRSEAGRVPRAASRARRSPCSPQWPAMTGGRPWRGSVATTEGGPRGVTRRATCSTPRRGTRAIAHRITPRGSEKGGRMRACPTPVRAGFAGTGDMRGLPGIERHAGAGIMVVRDFLVLNRRLA